MTRSYLVSLAIHSAILATIVVCWDSTPDAVANRSTTIVLVRAVKAVVAPPKPKMRAGLVEEIPVETEKSSTPPITDPETSPTKPIVESAKERKKSPSRPQLILPEHNYPKKPQFERSMASDPTLNDSPGSHPIDLNGAVEGRDHPAVPYYHPAVKLDGLSDREWILVRFEIETNGTFQVELLEGTGNLHQDARALNALRGWKWIPMRIANESVASVEIVRLFKRDLPGE